MSGPETSGLPTLPPPPDELLLLVGREIVERDLRPAQIHPQWMRTQLVSRTSDDAWAAVADADCVEFLHRACTLAEEDVDQAAAEAVEAAQLQPEPRATGARARPLALPAIWLDDAELPPHEPELLPGLIRKGDLGLVYGATSCGKTFFTIDLVGSIAARLPWRDREPAGGLVVYVAAEAGRSVLRRFIAWRDNRIGDAHDGRVPLVIVPKVVNLMSDGDVDDTIRELHMLEERAGEKLEMVVFDTLSRSMPGGDENKPGDMTTVIGAIDRVRATLDTGALLVHHCGKDATKGARGHSSLAAAVDVMISIEDRVATFEKVRDGKDGLAFPFELKTVELGRDAKDEPITTCLCIASDDAPLPPVPGKPRLGKNQELALKVLKGLLAAAKRNLKERGDDPEKACILATGWRAALEARDVPRNRYHELATDLQRKGLIRFDGPHVVPADGLA